jgi:mannose-6-phosphate isomerase
VELQIPENADKETVFKYMQSYIKSLPLKIAGADSTRPWGGSIYIDTSSLEDFLNLYFPEVDRDDLYKYGDLLSPKFMLMAPGQQLSWQYHNRRAEIWKIVIGPAKIVRSETNTVPEEYDLFKTGELEKHGPAIRHRWFGSDKWSVIAEIWQHTDPDNLSDEEDIVRLEDVYGRS